MDNLLNTSAPSADVTHRLFDGAVILHKRPDHINAKWQYRMKRPDGVTERKSTGVDDLDKAREIASVRWATVCSLSSRGVSIDGVTFKDVANAWCDDQRRLASRRQKATWIKRSLEIVEGKLIPYFDGRMLRDVTLEGIEAFHEREHELWRLAQQEPWEKRRFHIIEPKNASIRNTQAILKSIFEFAVQRGHVQQAEVPVMELVTYVPRYRAAFTEDDLALLFKRMEQRIDETSSRYHKSGRRLMLHYCKVLLLTGLRPGTEADLRFCDIISNESNRPHCVVQVRDGKTGPRQVLASIKLRDLIKEIKSHHPDPRPDASLWIKPDGTQTVRFEWQFNRLLKEIGMSTDAYGNKRSLYSFRHTYITNCILQHRSIGWIADNCGNSATIIQRVYNHVIHTAQLDQIPD